MFVKVEPSGCCERKGLVQIRFCMYLGESDYGYEKHHILRPIIPPEGYTGEMDGLSPKDIEDYQNWLDSLPKVWQTNPFHNHFIYVEPEISDEEIMAQMQFHLPNFYAAWCAGKPIRAGWDVKTRIHPKRYDRIESLEAYAFRKAICEERVQAVRSILAQIETNEKGETFPATAILIGPGAINRVTVATTAYTLIGLDNPANATGKITSFELWFNTNATGVKVGTFYGSGTDYTSRDVETVGNVTSGSKQTFSGLDCDVETGDFAGVYPATGEIEWDNTLELAGARHKIGDQFGAGQQTYTVAAAMAPSIYGTGETPPTEKSGTDTGSGVDAKASGNPIATLVLAETGVGVEALGDRIFDAAEVGLGADLALLLAEFSKVDTAVGIDIIIAFLKVAQKFGVDSGIGVDVSAPLKAFFSGLDAGVGVEAIVSRDLALTEAGLGVDARIALLAGLIRADAGAGVDISSRSFLVYDSGLGTDIAGPLLVTIIRTDTGSGVDIAYMYIPPSKLVSLIASLPSRQIIATLPKREIITTVGDRL